MVVEESRMDSLDPPQAESSQFLLEDIVQHPLPGYVAPISITFSPNDQYISYLYSPEHSLTRQLYVFDPNSRTQHLLVYPPGGGLDEHNMSNAERLRRERLRERSLGITRYDWSKVGSIQRILVPLPGGIYVQDGVGAELRCILPSSPESPVLDPQISPDGSMVAYVFEDELYVVDASSKNTRQLTFGAKMTGKTHGLAEYIAQEEMDRRNGFWWSHDSQMIAFSEVDCTHIPLYRIMHQGKAEVGAGAEEDHPYPFAGKRNAIVKLGVVSVASGEIQWMQLECGTGENNGDEEYLARVAWMFDGSLAVQVQNRLQTKLKLIKFDPINGGRKVLLTEENEVYINLNDCFSPLHKATNQLTTGFIWASERTGFRHLYLYDGNGNLQKAITQGDWMVEHVSGVDESAGLVYFTANAEGPLECHLYAARLFPPGMADDSSSAVSGIKKLTQLPGRHSVAIDHNMKRFVDVHDCVDSPPRVSLCAIEDGRTLLPIFEQVWSNPRWTKLKLSPPEIVTVKIKSGETLYGAIYRPDESIYGPPPYKTIVSVYGGPHVQTISNSWFLNVDMRVQYLRSHGFLVWKLDNRGSAKRGLKFEGAMKNKMGEVDVEDQVSGIKWLIHQGLCDEKRVGIYGWSYGGYLSAMALAKHPFIFKCAVSGAPVTAWDGYDTHYTERYMGLPAANAKEYERSAVMHHVHNMRGELMLVHGMIDENVHFRHTARLVNALVAHGKPYELLLFPDERHMPTGLKDRIYMEKRIFDFLSQSL